MFFLNNKNKKGSNQHYFGRAKNSAGFTLIEVMISTGLFVVLMVLGITAIMNSNSLFKKNQDQRAIFDNMAFVVEDMARLMRTGSSFRCVQSVALPLTSISENPENCPAPTQGALKPLLIFEAFGGDPTDPSDQVLYVFEQDGLKKKEQDGQTLYRMTPGNVKFDLGQSGFAVRGSLPNDGEQPLIFVRLVGEIENDLGDFVTEFSYQFSITPRRID